MSKEVYVAADSTKFGKDVTVGIAPLHKIDGIMTDHNVNKDFVKQFKKTSTDLIVTCFFSS
ncbi:hypothetical protein [Bacillus manliponensis]|uniref:hypothetical protein n=1 Tax=Bacillus manliponensis TaxID=574376 RepID=UPI003513DBB3